MNDYSELKKAAAYAQDFDNFADEAEEMRALSQFYDEVDPAAVLELIAENEQLAAKIEQVRSRSVSLDYSKDAVIPNALDAWGRVVPQHLPYDFSGNPGASATQYCNGWNDAGGYWKAHCVDIQSERDQLKAENDRLRKLPTCWSEVLEQSEANDELLDKVLELGADAERYRFLCDKFGETKLPCALERILAGDLYVADGKSSIDSAIDAAMGKVVLHD